VVLNAAKYSDPGARIEVRGTESEGSVVIEVADTGWGIADEDLPHVWDDLFRARAARGIEGSGLGLSLVRVVIERHGGQVSLRSRAGAGTSVRLEIPAAMR
jgi:two-component system OmpR family sensor kinase